MIGSLEGLWKKVGIVATFFQRFVTTIESEG
jgi:hypothetical protein